MRARAIWRTAVPAVLMVLAAAPGAQAQSVAEQRASIEVFRDYAPDGRISPCKHSSKVLELAQGAIPPDIEQYAADYPAAIEAALEARARGECEPGSPKTALAVPAATATPAPTQAAPAASPAPGAPTQRVVPDPPEPEASPVAARAAAGSDVALDRVATASAANDAPAPVLLLGVLALIVAIIALALFAMKRFGVGDDRLAGAAHAIREARWRTSGTWQDFLDWVRLGR